MRACRRGSLIASHTSPDPLAGTTSLCHAAWVRWFFPLLVLALLNAPAHAAPETPCRPLGRGETLALDAAELALGDLTRLVSCALDRNLLLSPPTLAGKTIGILAPRPLTRRDLLTVWHTALERHGLVEERRGALYLVRPSRRPI